METKESEDLAKPRRKTVSGSQNIDAELATARPESLSEKEETPRDDQDMEDKDDRCYIPIQRNSIFNRAMRHRRHTKARGASEGTASRPADSQENGKSVNKSESRAPLSRTAVETRTGAWKPSSQVRKPRSNKI